MAHYWHSFSLAIDKQGKQLRSLPPEIAKRRRVGQALYMCWCGATPAELGTCEGMRAGSPCDRPAEMTVEGLELCDWHGTMHLSAALHHAG